ncbi:MAG: tyrosine-protein phosphatase [Pseudomonadota bacterium]
MLEMLTPARLVIGPRPGKKSIDRLSQLGLTHCCTLLGEKEEPWRIEKMCSKMRCEWLWLPVTGGGLDTLNSTPMRDHILKLHNALTGVENPKIYIHCSAGIHRTGYVTFILLRMMGLGKSAALEALSEIRSVTAEQVGDERISAAEAFVESYLSDDI